MLSKLYMQAEQAGLDNRLIQLTEEMSELTKAICKLKRYYLEDKTLNQTIYQIRENLIEELADVDFCLEQVKYLLGARDKVENIKEEKLIRTEKRLKGE